MYFLLVQMGKPTFKHQQQNISRSSTPKWLHRSWLWVTLWQSNSSTSFAVSFTSRNGERINQSSAPKPQKTRQSQQIATNQKRERFSMTSSDVYHLESRWRNSHGLVYHGPLLIQLLGLAPSTFTMVYSFVTFEAFTIHLFMVNRSQHMTSQRLPTSSMTGL